MMLTAERLRAVVCYDPETGVFTWLPRGDDPRFNRRWAGKPAATGRSVKVDGVSYKTHRLAWLYMTGEWPDGELDHRDRNADNHRWRNLRPATRRQQQVNQKLRKTNTSGAKGVRFHKGAWSAQIRIDGKAKHLGRFGSKEEAMSAYATAATAQHGDFVGALW